jgi:hypothetical protein
MVSADNTATGEWFGTAHESIVAISWPALMIATPRNGKNP